MLDATPASATPLRGHVLVVEDNRINCMVIESLLGKLGVTMSLASDGQEALDAITQMNRGATSDQPELILMDLQMPVMDGYTATQKIRQWEAANTQPRIPIIALTADAFEEDRLRCMAVGMDDFLSKPVSIDLLKAALVKWLPGSMPMRVPTPAPLEPRSLDLELFKARVDELTLLLQQNKFSAVSRFHALQTLVAGTDLAGDIEAAAAFLAEMRFDQVLECLRKTVSDLGDQTGK
jgi:CheY-like chemotaxis protein